MNQTPKLAQRLASVFLVSLVLPVSLMAQFQSAFVKGALQQAKNERTEAHDAYRAQRAITADLKAQRKNAATQAEKDALTAQIQASRQIQLALLGSLEAARIGVQLERMNRIGSDVDAAGLQSLANQARDLAAQIAALDLTTQAGVDEARRLQAELKDLDRNEIRSAINTAKFATASAILEGALGIIAEAGVSVQCDAQVAAFNQQSAWSSNSPQLFRDARACLLGGPIMGICGEHVGTGGVVAPTGAYGTGLIGAPTGSGVPMEEQPGAVLLPGGGVQAPSDCVFPGAGWTALGAVYVDGPPPAGAIEVTGVPGMYYTFGPSGEYQFYGTGIPAGPVSRNSIWANDFGMLQNKYGDAFDIESYTSRVNAVTCSSNTTDPALRRECAERRAFNLIIAQERFRAQVLGVGSGTASALHRWAQAHGLSDVTVEQAFYAWANQNEDRAAKVQELWERSNQGFGSSGLFSTWAERDAFFGEDRIWPNNYR